MIPWLAGCSGYHSSKRRLRHCMHYPLSVMNDVVQPSLGFITSIQRLEVLFWRGSFFSWPLVGLTNWVPRPHPCCCCLVLALVLLSLLSSVVLLPPWFIVEHPRSTLRAGTHSNVWRVLGRLCCPVIIVSSSSWCIKKFVSNKVMK